MTSVARGDGEQRDLAVEIDEFLDDNVRPVAAHVLHRIVPGRPNLVGIPDSRLALAELDMTGLITHASPTSVAAAIASSRLSAKR